MVVTLACASLSPLEPRVQLNKVARVTQPPRSRAACGHGVLTQAVLIQAKQLADGIFQARLLLKQDYQACAVSVWSLDVSGCWPMCSFNLPYVLRRSGQP